MDYRAHGGKGNSQDVADFIEREFLSEEPEPASLEIAKEFINDFCVAEYGSPADFSDLEKVGIAYTTVTDEEIPIQVNADLVHYRIERYLDGQFLERRQYESLDELIQNELAELDFDDLISVSDAELESIGATPEQGSDDYRLLSRLKADCDYFLGAGGRAEKHLWAGNVREQIAKMRELYAALPDEPEWLTMEDIDRYAQRMEPPYEVVVYHHFENGVDERLDYQTLAEAEQAAQKYVAGTMEGEDGFAYDGAGIYDFNENAEWLRRSTGTSPMNGPSSRRRLPQRNCKPARSRTFYSLKKKNRLRCRKSAPAVSALPSPLCTRRSPGISAMISTSPTTPWATAPPARNTRPMLPPSAP